VKRYPTYSKKVRVIPNGYDEDEFANLPIRTGSNHRMVLCHAGTLFPTYDPNPLFSALASVLRASPPTRDQLRVRMLGNRSEREAIARWNLTGVVDECPWKPRDVVLEELAACDATILCMSGPRARDFWVPAKTYMYLRLGKPILALVPCGEARAIVERAGVGRICDPNNVIEIADTIHQMFQEWESGRLTASPDWDHIRQFEGTALTSQLSTVLEDLGRWRRVYPVVHH